MSWNGLVKDEQSLTVFMCSVMVCGRDLASVFFLVWEVNTLLPLSLCKLSCNEANNPGVWSARSLGSAAGWKGHGFKRQGCQASTWVRPITLSAPGAPCHGWLRSDPNFLISWDIWKENITMRQIKYQYFLLIKILVFLGDIRLGFFSF